MGVTREIFKPHLNVFSYLRLKFEMVLQAPSTQGGNIRKPVSPTAPVLLAAGLCLGWRQRPGAGHKAFPRFPRHAQGLQLELGLPGVGQALARPHHCPPPPLSEDALHSDRCLPTGRAPGSLSRKRALFLAREGPPSLVVKILIALPCVYTVLVIFINKRESALCSINLLTPSRYTYTVYAG